MTARIYGTVKDANTGTVITTATVTAPPYSVVNASGNYYFITPGAVSNVTITASAAGYTSKNETVSVPNGAVKQVNFSLNPV